MVAVLTGRDRAVDAGGGAHDRAAVSLAVRATASGVVQGIDDTTAGGPAGLADLVGADLRSGFGRRWTAALPADAAERTVLAALLDDLPGALLVSGYALARGGHLTLGHGEPGGRSRRGRPTSARAGPSAGRSTTCWRPRAGWRSRRARPRLRWSGPTPAAGTRSPRWGRGPSAAAGCWRWPRGRRRALAVRAHFRDSWTGDGREIALHEYEVEATVDGDGAHRPGRGRSPGCSRGTRARVRWAARPGWWVSMWRTSPRTCGPSSRGRRPAPT